MTPPHRDPGLPQERTALAWHRTLLAFAVGSLIAARVLAAALDVWAVVVALAGLVWTAALWVVAHRHGRSRLRAGSARGGPLPRPDGLLLAATAALTAGGALLGLADVTLGVLRR